MQKQANLKPWYLLLVAFVSSVTVGGAAIWYADSVDRKSNQQWCEVVTALDDAYAAQPPQTATGQRIAGEMRRMRHDFGC